MKKRRANRLVVVSVICNWMFTASMVHAQTCSQRIAQPSYGIGIDMNGNGIKNDSGYLLCYSAKRGKYANKHIPVLGLQTANEFGDEFIDTRKEENLCMPARLISGL